jgi:hypothetical protein
MLSSPVEVFSLFHCPKSPLLFLKLLSWFTRVSRNPSLTRPSAETPHCLIIYSTTIFFLLHSLFWLRTELRSMNRAGECFEQVRPCSSLCMRLLSRHTMNHAKRGCVCGGGGGDVSSKNLFYFLSIKFSNNVQNDIWQFS